MLQGYVEGMINLEGGGGGASDYTDLQNKPSINNVELVGNKTTEDLNISYDDLQDKPTIRNMPDSSGAAAGDVLTHTASGDEWQPPVKELPPYTTEDEKYLKAVNGNLEWAEVSGDKIIYSTTEYAIGRWIDGKTVYQKTIEIPNFSANDWVSFLVNQNSKLIELVNGYLITADGWSLPFGYRDSANAFISFILNMQNLEGLANVNGYISIFTTLASSSFTGGIATLRYIKTTD